MIVAFLTPLTYMSIHDGINDRIGDQRICRLVPHNKKDPRQRTVLMSQEITEMVDGPWQDGLMGDRCARLRADLENFVTGARMTVCWEPFEAKKEAQIGRLDPIGDEVWDFRCQEPSPGLRVFCRFADKDILVALTCYPRSISVPWLDRLPLLDSKRRWRRAIIDCRSEWKKLFPAHEPISRDHIDEYLSNAILQ
jgi:hypothetical protein